ncbi:LuxR C-terminal-related transcriptional regulator [Kribbella sp. NPDC002412]
MSTPVLATKLFPPAKRPEVVARPRLADRLDRTLHPGHRLTLVSAPPGFGKTTLLSEWARSQEHMGWLSLDEGDNDPARFMAHLSAALSRLGLDLDPDALTAASTPAALVAIVNELMERPDHALLVLDDYHVIDAPEVHEAMTFLLDHAPDHLHLLVATRTDPPFPLPRLRSRGQLTEVRAADLRFAPTEAAEFLNDAMGLQLGEDDVQRLDERTEGWIAGLQLAALSLRGTADRADVAEFISAFTGSNRFVIDYLVDEVLARQSADVRDFLLRTAVLDRLTGPLCDALTSRTDGGKTLADLDRGNVFLVPLDAERSWYRYHHLFRDVLHARLLAEAPDEVPTLHRAASAWYAAHDLAADAVRHALAAGDHDRAAYLIEEALPQVRRARQDSLLLEWIRSLPESVVRRSPVLSIVSGWSQMLAGDLDGMERRLDDVEAALAAGARDKALAATWADTEDLRTAPATLWVYRAALAQARGDVPATVRHARHALELAGAEDHFVRGASAGFLGLAAWATGDVPEALSTFSEAVRSLHAAGNLVDELDSTVVLGDMWISAGRPHWARRLYEEGLAAGSGPPYPRAAADLHVGLAELDRELNDLAAAEEHLETARVLGEHGSITENRHRWYVAMAQVHAVRGDYASAKQLLDQAADLYRPGSYPDLRPIAAMRARLSIAEGDLDAAAEWAELHVTTADEASYLHEYEHLTLVRLLLARHHRDSSAALDDGLTLLHRLHAAAEAHGRGLDDAKPTRAGSLLEIGMLQALTLHARGQQAETLAELNRALTAAPEPDAYVRLFLDEGAPMLALLRDAVSSEYDVLQRHARRLLDSVDDRVPVIQASGAPASHAAAPPATTLSERELDVLRLLASELTGPEIARHLFVSLNTLRTHTKRIFTKLDVNTRSAAVRRGRELGLL